MPQDTPQRESADRETRSSEGAPRHSPGAGHGALAAEARKQNRPITSQLEAALRKHIADLSDRAVNV